MLNFQVNLARLVFIIAFEHIIFLLMGLVDYFIPDVPEAVETRLRREKFLARQALFNAQFEKESEERRKKRAKKLGKFGSISTLGSEAKKKGRSNKERASPITLTPSPPASLHSAKMPEPEGIALAEETIPADYGSLPPQSPSKRKTSKLPTLKGLFKGKSKGPSSGYTEI